MYYRGGGKPFSGFIESPAGRITSQSWTRSAAVANVVPSREKAAHQPPAECGIESSSCRGCGKNSCSAVSAHEPSQSEGVRGRSARLQRPNASNPARRFRPSDTRAARRRLAERPRTPSKEKADAHSSPRLPQNHALHRDKPGGGVASERLAGFTQLNCGHPTPHRHTGRGVFSRGCAAPLAPCP